MDKNLTYQKARRIRGTKLTDLLADQLLYEPTIAKAIGKTISLKAQSSIKGIQAKFDPLNIVKFLTFGSKLGPALYGKLAGRDIRDIEYFTGRNRPLRVGPGKSTASKIGPVPGADGDIGGINQQLLKIYSYLKKSNEFDTKRREKEQNFAEEKELESKRRHKELLEALSKLGAKPTTTIVKKEGKEDKGIFGGLFDDLMKMIESLKEKIQGIFGEIKALFEVLGGKKLLFDALRALGGILLNPLTFVLVGGALLSYLAAKIVEDPNFQKAFSEKMDPYGLLSAMAGDAGFASQIMSASAKNEREKKLVENAIQVKQGLLKDTPWYKRIYDFGSRDYLVKEKGLTEQEADFLMPGNQNDSEKFGKIEDREKMLESIRQKTSKKTQPVSTVSKGPDQSDAETARLTRQNAAAAPKPAIVPGSVSQQLNTVMAENVSANLPSKPNTQKQNVVNNISQSRANQKQKLARLEEIAVHNDEPTFMRMIMGSTRVV